MEIELVFKGENGQVLTNSLCVSKAFGKEHKRVMQDIRELTCSQEFRQHNFVQSSYLNNQNKEQPLYIMTEDGFTFLAMGYTGKKASEFKEKYINQFNLMKEKIEDENKNKFPIPQTFSQALMLAAKQAEQIEQQNKLIEVKDTQILELKPKATYYDTILSSKKAECISVFSKSDYGISGMAMNKLLHDWGIQYKVGKTWLPYQEYASLGYTKTETITINEDKDTVIQTKWTQQGRLFIYEQMKKHGYFPLIEK